MPDDVTPTQPSEWFQPPDYPDAGPPSSGDLRWPTTPPQAPPEPAPQHVARDAVVVAQPEYPRPTAIATLEDVASGGNGWKVRHAEIAEHRPWEFAPPSLFEPLSPAETVAKAPRRRTPPQRFAALGVAVVALVALAALALTDFSHAPPSITQPTTVGALTQLNDPQLDSAMQTLQRAVLTAGATNVVDGVYGTNGRPQLVLIVVQGTSGANGGAQAGLQSFFNGLVTGAGASGWNVDRAHATLTSVNGTSFECSPVSAPALQGTKLSTCAWTDSNVAGVVFDVTGQPMAETLNQAVQARSATER